MKPIIMAICHLIFILPGDCQTSWFPIGAKWHYEFSSFSGQGLTTLEVLNEDTLIANHAYKKLLSTTILSTPPGSLDTITEYLYVFEDNDVVYGYNKWIGSTFLYDFNAVVGDTLDMFFGGISPQPFIVDSIGVIEINDSLLAFQDIRFPSLFDQGEYDEMRVIEGIGSINSHLFHGYTILQPFDFPFYLFRCYEDETIGLVNLSYNQNDCDYIEGITSQKEIIKAETSVFPNPSSDFVTISTESQHIEKLLVIDVLGYVRISDITFEPTLKIDISELENGLFFLIGLDTSGKMHFTARFTKFSG